MDVAVYLSRTSSNCVVILDGQNLPCVRAVEIRAGVGQITEVLLTLIPDRVEIAGTPGRVVFQNQPEPQPPDSTPIP